jgi:hypothetical protein
MKNCIYVISLLLSFQFKAISQKSSAYTENDFKVILGEESKAMFSVKLPTGDDDQFTYDMVNSVGKVYKDYYSYFDDKTHTHVFGAVLPGKYTLKIKKQGKVIASRSIEIKEK